MFMYQKRTLRQAVRLALLFGVPILVGCGSGGGAGLSAEVDSAPGGPSPDSVPTDSVPSPDTLPVPDSLPGPDSLAPPDPPPIDSLPGPDAEPLPEYSGLPFGPFGLWAWNTPLDARLAPFTGSHNFTNPDSIVIQIDRSRSNRHRLMLNMTGGPSARYTTDGKFDMVKWKSRMDRFNTTEIRRAVAAGVADGTIIGNSVIDEPETRQWGNVVTKALIDEMGLYVKAIFPTLPVGVDHGPPAAYEWRTSERYRVIDYAIYQYAWWVTRGDVAAWRDQVRSLAKQDGVAVAFSINVVNGGVQDREDWECKGTGGKGSRFPNCQLTTQQLRDWIETLGTDGCAVLLWRYYEEFFARESNQDALKEIAAKLSQAPRQSCTRSGS